MLSTDILSIPHKNTQSEMLWSASENHWNFFEFFAIFIGRRNEKQIKKWFQQKPRHSFWVILMILFMDFFFIFIFFFLILFLLLALFVHTINETKRRKQRKQNNKTMLLDILGIWIYIQVTSRYNQAGVSFYNLMFILFY